MKEKNNPKVKKPEERGYKITAWDNLPLLSFVGSKIRPLVTLTECSDMSCYYLEVPKDTVVEEAYHKVAVEVIWIMEGAGKALLDGKSIPVKSGDVIFVKQRTSHGFITGEHGMKMLSMLSTHVDSRTDYYPVDGKNHGYANVLSGEFMESEVGVESK